MKRILWIILVAAAGVLLGWLASQWLSGAKHDALSEAPRGGDFTLNAPNGPFQLQAQHGKLVLIYFGYTYCPDVCPTNLALMAQALNAMSEQELVGVQGVFISVDPERDTLERLALYTDHFHPNIIGVTGTPDEVARVAAQYGAAYLKVEGESQGGYLVDHSSNTYVIAQDGSLHTILPHATPAQDILKLSRELLAQTQSSH